MALLAKPKEDKSISSGKLICPLSPACQVRQSSVRFDLAIREREFNVCGRAVQRGISNEADGQLQPLDRRMVNLNVQVDDARTRRWRVVGVVPGQDKSPGGLVHSRTDRAG